MATEGLHDTPPKGRKKGQISIVGPFAPGAPSWSYAKDSYDHDRTEAIDEAEEWLRQTSRARHQKGPKSLERLHALLYDQDLEEEQPIRAALKAGKHPMALLLDENGRRDAFWPGTALHAVISCHHDGCAAKLLELLLSDPRVRADVDRPNAQGWTALAWCVLRSNQYLDSVRVLLAHGADPNQVAPLFWEDRALAGLSLIAGVLKRGGLYRCEEWQCVRLLFAAGANPPAVPDHRAIALGACTGYMPWIEQGIAAGVDVNATAPAVFGEATTPLVVAVSTGDLPMTRALLTAGAWFSSKVPIFFRAIDQLWRFKVGHAPDAVSPERTVVDMVKLLLKENVDAKEIHRGESVFDALAENSDLKKNPGVVMELALLLQEAGAKPTSSTLRCAVESYPVIEIVEALLAVGCDPHEVDHSAPEPISAAAYLRKKLQEPIDSLHDAEETAAALALFDERDLKSVKGPKKSKATKPKRVM